MTTLNQQQIDELRELYERTSQRNRMWTTRYLRSFCPGKRYDLEGGLSVITGEADCLYPERKGQQCDGHDNQNWSDLFGPETYRDERLNIEYIESRTAQWIAAAHNAMPALIETLAEAQRWHDEVALVVKDWARGTGTACEPKAVGDFLMQMRATLAEKDDAATVWAHSPNRAFDGKKCTECGFDNRFHGEDCLFQSPGLRITSAAFNSVVDENTSLRAELQQANERVVELTEALTACVKPAATTCVSNCDECVSTPHHPIDGVYKHCGASVLDSERSPERHGYKLDSHLFVCKHCGMPRSAEVHDIFADVGPPQLTSDLVVVNERDPKTGEVFTVQVPDTRIVFEQGNTGPCSACGDGDTAQQYHKHGEAAAVDETPMAVEVALKELREMFPSMYCFIDINQRGHVRYDNGEIGVTTGVVISVQLINEDLRCVGTNISEAMQKVREFSGKELSHE